MGFLCTGGLDSLAGVRVAMYPRELRVFSDGEFRRGREVPVPTLSASVVCAACKDVIFLEVPPDTIGVVVIKCGRRSYTEDPDERNRHTTDVLRAIGKWSMESRHYEEDGVTEKPKYRFPEWLG